MAILRPDRSAIVLKTDGKNPKHTNTDGTLGYWVGVALQAPEDATGFKYYFVNGSDYEDDATLTSGSAADLLPGSGIPNMEAGKVDDAKYVCFWIDAGAVAPKNCIDIQWVGDNGNIGGVESYYVNLREVQLTRYAINIADTEHGTVETGILGVGRGDTASENDTVVVNATPDEGYELDTITVTKADGVTPIDVDIEIDDAGEKKLGRFTMPACDVIVTVTFKTQ